MTYSARLYDPATPNGAPIEVECQSKTELDNIVRDIVAELHTDDEFFAYFLSVTNNESESNHG
jgi:hypothetical protein